MKIEVIINGVTIHEQPIDHWEVEFVTNHLEGRYQFEMLRACGIECGMFITGVQSRMNSSYFKEVPEAYDHLINIG